MSDINQPIFKVEGGEGNYFAGRDINFHMYQPEFFTPNLDEYKDSKYISPLKASTLIEMVLRERFVVLGGDGYEKKSLARYIAWSVLEEKPDKSIEVKEWIGSANPQNFEQYMQNDENPTIFILPNLSPQNADNNLSGLFKIARDQGQYLIITTKNPKEKWNLGGEIESLFWQPIPTEPLYEARELHWKLTESLNAVRYRLPDGLRGMEFEAGKVLMGKLMLNDIAAKLKSPESIEAFVNSLVSFEKPVTESVIQELVHKCQSDSREIRKWYNEFLTPRDQLIALGLCLFDGFYDDQFFAAVETLVEEAWQKRDSSLLGLDYCDLDSLRNYYSLTPVKQDGVKRVESNHVNQRLELLKIAWESHRRQILSALPIMEDLVRSSVLPGFLNTELCGTKDRRQQLRQVIAETFCNIGLQSIGAIEDTLMRLAAEEDLAVQVVVARAMAGWREYDQDKKLFDALQRWQDDTTFMQIIKSILENRSTEDTKMDITPEVFIKATLALTVGFAALYDPPNKLDEKLCDLLKQLAEDTGNPFIRTRFADYTLPHVVRAHAVQVQETLLDMCRLPYLNAPIAVSLAKAYAEKPDEVADILDDWFDLCQTTRPPRLSKEEVTHRDGILATVAFTYGAVQYSKKKAKERIPIDDGFDRLQNILEEEINIYVRLAVVNAVLLQISFDFEKVDEYVIPLFSYMHTYEMDLIVAELVQIHLGQREELKDGDEMFQWNNKKYPVWLHRERPQTVVEKMIGKWLKDSSNKTTQQLAIRFKTSERLVKFEKEEETFIENQKEKWLKQEEQREHDEEDYAPPVFQKTRTRGKVSAWILSGLVTLPKPRFRATVRGLLPEVLSQKTSNRDALESALEKLKKDPDREIQIIAGQLNRAVSIMNKKAIILFSVILFAAALIFLFFR